MTSRIGYVIEGQTAGSDAALIAHIAKLRPTWLVVLNNPNLARRLHDASPLTNVAMRRVGADHADETFWRTVTPGQWVAARQAELDVFPGGWLYVTNEPGNGVDLLDWTSSLIEYTAGKGLRLVVGNFSTGTPEAQDWLHPAMQRLLRLLDKHRNRVVLGLHEYWGGVATSGFIGGDPESRGLIDPAKWPTRAMLGGVMKWHCGRFERLLSACKTIGVNPPRIVITEHGADYLGDIAFWLDKLPGGKPRGWRDLSEAWKAWWPQWTPERAYAEQLIYLDREVYSGTPVEGQAVFMWGGTEQWRSHNVRDAGDLHARLVAYAASSHPQPPPAPPPKPEPPQPPPAPDVTGLEQRVAALEQQVDTLAGALGAIARVLDRVRDQLNSPAGKD